MRRPLGRTSRAPAAKWAKWLTDRYQMKVDRASGIKTDSNDRAGRRYIENLVARIVRVSGETVEIVESVPTLGV